MSCLSNTNILMVDPKENKNNNKFRYNCTFYFVDLKLKALINTLNLRIIGKCKLQTVNFTDRIFLI